jgi:GH25 family lysozyme M1 (1,4-beta-N-acetylmuramidase)
MLPDEVIIDIGWPQGEIDHDLAGPCIDVALIRVCNGHAEDKQFKRNKAGFGQFPHIWRIYWGFYYLDVEPAKFADQVLELVQPGPLDVIAVDLEDHETSWIKKNKGKPVVGDRILTALELLEAGSYHKPMIYTARDWWLNNVCVGTIPYIKEGAPPPWTGNYMLWNANYTDRNWPVMPPGWYRWTFWQYYTHGRIPGITQWNGLPCDVDLNIACMPPAMLRASLGLPPLPARPTRVEPDPSVGVTYVVTASKGLLIRERPWGEQVGGLAFNEKVQVLEIQGGWARIDRGWCSMDYLKRVTQ